MKRPYENAVERAYSNIERGVGWEVWLAWPSSTSLRFERTALPRVLHGFFQVFFSYGVRRLQRVCVCVCSVCCGYWAGFFPESSFRSPLNRFPPPSSNILALGKG